MVGEGGRQWQHLAPPLPSPTPCPGRAPCLVSRPLAPLAHPDSKLERRAEEQTSSFHSPYPGLYGQGQELGFPLLGSQEPSGRDSLNMVHPTSQPLSSHASSMLAVLQDNTLKSSAGPPFPLPITGLFKRCQKVTTARQTGITPQDSFQSTVPGHKPS